MAVEMFFTAEEHIVDTPPQAIPLGFNSVQSTNAKNTARNAETPTVLVGRFLGLSGKYSPPLHGLYTRSLGPWDGCVPTDLSSTRSAKFVPSYASSLAGSKLTQERMVLSVRFSLRHPRKCGHPRQRSALLLHLA